jgi:hypothetical protein
MSHHNVSDPVIVIAEIEVQSHALIPGDVTSIQYPFVQ